MKYYHTYITCFNVYVMFTTEFIIPFVEKYFLVDFIIVWNPRVTVVRLWHKRRPVTCGFPTMWFHMNYQGWNIPFGKYIILYWFKCKIYNIYNFKLPGIVLRSVYYHICFVTGISICTIKHKLMVCFCNAISFWVPVNLKKLRWENITMYTWLRKIQIEVKIYMEN